MELRFTYEKKEWIRGYRLYQFIMKRITKLELVVMALLPVIWGGMFFIEGMSMFTSILLAALVLVYGTTGFILFIQPELIFKKTEKYHQEYQMIFTDNTILFETTEISSKLGWDVYSGYCEKKEFFYLLQKNVNYTLLPKRAFKTKQEEDKFRELLKKKYD
ncbi:MAG: YcxB family protein [bacterium]|nr:YcxB family protein [bacterium]